MNHLREQWRNRIAVALESRPRPTKGMFSRGRADLDPRFFEGDKLKAEVRDRALDALDGFWGPRYGDWRQWARVYLAGSGASHWWDSDADLDILIGINKSALDKARPQNVGVSETDVVARLNHDFKNFLDPETATADFGGSAVAITFFVNPGSYDIREIVPYAAFDITGNQWVVRPPDLPEGWGPDSFPASMWQEANEIADEAERILSRPEPERTMRAVAFFDQLHELRRRSYAPGGRGWMDTGNFMWQALSQWGILPKLYKLKHPEKTAITRQAEYDYRRDHQPLKTAPLHDLTQANGEDIYAHPEWFAGDPNSQHFRESVRAYRSVRNQPNAMITIYRAAPKGITSVNHGDWVTLSEAYARMHAMQNNDPADDWPVYAASVRVGDVWWDGSEVNEFGYWGPDAAARVV